MAQFINSINSSNYVGACELLNIEDYCTVTNINIRKLDFVNKKNGAKMGEVSAINCISTLKSEDNKALIYKKSVKPNAFSGNYGGFSLDAQSAILRFKVSDNLYLIASSRAETYEGGFVTTNSDWSFSDGNFPYEFLIKGGFLWDGSVNNPSNYYSVIIPWYFDFGGKRYYQFRCAIHKRDATNFKDFLPSTGKFVCLDDIEGFNFDIIEKSEEYGNYSSSGGYGGGSFDDSSDSFGLPSLPSLGVSQAGFVNVYKPTAGQLVGFADDLFPDFEMPSPSTKEGIDGVVENLNNVASVLGFFADSYLNKGLVDYVIDCHIVPVAPSITSNTGIKVGYKTFNYNPSKVTSDYVEFDCGTLQIAEYYQNFLDYEGTRAKLYAPFIGFVDIKPEWFQSGSLRLVYHFNIIDGSCIAFVIATSSKSKLTNTVVATFGGNCCVHMPITGLNYSSMISGILGGASKVLSGQIASGVEQSVLARPTIEQSNGYNAGMSFMCYRRPYLLIERPVASFSKDYPKEQGLPLNVTKKLGSLKGFTTCTAPIVDNFHCLEEEKELIKQALIEGTIF